MTLFSLCLVAYRVAFFERTRIQPEKAGNQYRRALLQNACMHQGYTNRLKRVNDDLAIKASCRPHISEKQHE